MSLSREMGVIWDSYAEWVSERHLGGPGAVATVGPGGVLDDPKALQLFLHREGLDEDPPLDVERELPTLWCLTPGSRLPVRFGAWLSYLYAELLEEEACLAEWDRRQPDHERRVKERRENR